MSIPVKTALLRFVRVFAFGGAVALLAYLSGHMDDWHVPTIYMPIVTAALAALDKLIREQFKEAQDE